MPLYNPASGSAAGPTFATGDYIGPAFITNGALATGSGRAYFIPIPIFKAVSVTAVSCRVTTLAASSTIRLGIYRDNAGRPSTLVVDAGTIDSSTTGAKDSGAISTALPAGWYWGCAQVEGGTPAVDGNTNIIALAPKTDITAPATGAGFFYNHTGALAADVSAQSFTAQTAVPLVYFKSA